MNIDDKTAIRKPLVSAPRAIRPCLVVLSGGEIGRVFAIEGNKTLIGRGAECELQLPDDSVSRKHAKIVLQGGVMMLKDLDSTNGTYVNGERCKLRALEDGDRVQIGSVTILKFSLQDELEERLQQHLYDAAVRDALTQVYNRRFFEEELLRAVHHALRHGMALSLALLDLDHFKAINDTYGHPAGDSVLREVAARCMGTLRSEDVLCRVGGEEFAVIARSTTAQNTLIMAERLRQRIASAPVIHAGQRIPVTTSIGVVGFDRLLHASTETFYQAADQALYQAKDGGRNRVHAG